MKIKLLSAILASLAITVFLPGVTLAPQVLASAPIAKLTPAPRRFVARLPLAAASTAPQKKIAANGRESLGVETTAAHVYVVDDKSGVALFAKGENDQAPIASITKLMTARVLRSRGLDWNRIMTIGKLTDNGGVAYFAPGDQATVRNVWRAMLIGSSNTAVNTLVAASGLTTEEFVREMNASAAGLGLVKTRFVDPTGLDENNVSTAREVSLLARVVFSDIEVSNTVIAPEFILEKNVGKERRVVSTDKLLTSFISKPPYKIIGGKTGYIVESGYNVVISAAKDKAGAVTAVVLGSASNNLRFQEAKSLIHWTFENYHWPSSKLSVASR